MPFCRRSVRGRKSEYDEHPRRRSSALSFLELTSLKDRLLKHKYLRALLELTYKWDLALLSHYSWRVAAVREKRRSYASWLLVQEVFACASAIVSHVLAVPKLTPKNAFRLRKPSVLTDCLRRFDL